MYTKLQINRANKSSVHKIGENENRIHFEVIFFDGKQKKHEHYVTFLRGKPLLESFNCDCYWCSYYGWDKKNKRLVKLCSNSLAVGKHLKIPQVLEVLEGTK